MKTRRQHNRVQGEGDYEAARRYRADVEQYVKTADIEKSARDAAPEDSAESRELLAAEQAGRARAAKSARPADARGKPSPRKGEAEAPEGPYDKMSFPVAALGELSAAAVAAHLELYEGYLKQANEIAQALADRSGGTPDSGPERPREALARRLAFELNGVRLHEWFFEQFTPREDGKVPQDSIARQAMDATFGGFGGWLADIKALGEIRGPGWVIATWDPKAGRITNGWIDLHQLSVPAGQSVVFVLDLWEHAYWTDFGSKGRGRYVETMLRHTDWHFVADRIRP